MTLGELSRQPDRRTHKGGHVPNIDKLEVDLFRLPLPLAMGAAAAGVMTAFDMVAARITDSEGVTGVGYTVMRTYGANALT